MRKTGRQRCFEKRERNLKKLHIEYKDYLKSPLWQMIRTSVLNKRKHVCYFCNGKATEVHHTRYTSTVLYALNSHYFGGLVATCRNCHQTISDYAKTKKINESEAFRLFNMKRKAT